MRVLITGARGQVGRALIASAPSAVRLLALGHEDLDIADEAAVAACCAAFEPDLIINAAAYTAVDRAESEPELARRVNADGPACLARAARDRGARLLHVSTDFVFDGAASSPYRPEAAPNPLSVYGRSKLGGEIAVAEILPDRGTVLRTSWVYDATGRNFLRTMLRLLQAKQPVRVVADQVGTPTAARSVAAALWALARHSQAKGIYHWTDAGVASWYDFAVAIAEEATERGLLEGGAGVLPITTAEYPTPARRPPYSVLDKQGSLALGLTPTHWRQTLRTVLAELTGG